ncbi:hypothetical protein ACLOJK_041916 [Asimina triloba]
MLLVLLTSLLADRLIGTKDVNNLVLKEILSNSSAAKAACFAVYCFITPLMEELMYRGFLLTSIASTMEWWWAVILSSFVFSAAHLSLENAPQLFIIRMCPWMLVLLEWKLDVILCHPFAVQCTDTFGNNAKLKKVSGEKQSCSSGDSVGIL